MRRQRICRAFAAGLIAVAPALVVAQQPNAQCASQVVQVRDACQQALDFLGYVAPQLGAAVAGGNATLGQGGTLGGLGHFSLGVRGNLEAATVPSVDNFNPSYTGVQKRVLPSGALANLIPMPTADAALGIFRGLRVGATDMLGVDALVTVSYVPSLAMSTSNDSEAERLSTPSGSYKFGYGVRVGVVQETRTLPGVAVTYAKPDLPTMSLSDQWDAGSAVLGNSGALRFTTLDVSTADWRLVASKSLLLFSFAVGAGQDRYTQSASATAEVDPLVTPNPAVNVPAATSTAVAFTQHTTRTSVFADLSLNLPGFKLVGEYGQVSGGNVSTYNSFARAGANVARAHVSLGIRVGW
jgi:hypothetical protein